MRARTPRPPQEAPRMQPIPCRTETSFTMLLSDMLLRPAASLTRDRCPHGSPWSASTGFCPVRLCSGSASRSASRDASHHADLPA